MLSLLLKVILFWFISIILSLYIHELGHLIVGLVNGWRFMMISVGPLKFYRSNIKEKVKIALERNITNWFGISACVPEKHSNDNVNIWAKVLIGGPIFSLTLGFIFLVVAFILKSLFLLMLGAVSFAIGLMNFFPLPIRTGLFYNDGKRFKRIKQGGVTAKEEQEILNIVEKGVIYGDSALIYEDDCKMLLSSDDNVYRYYGYYLLYYSAREYDNELANNYYQMATNIGKNMPASVIKMFPLDNGV